MGSGENYARDTPGHSISKTTTLRHAKRMNAGFFDGHAEALTNQQTTDPAYFAPTNSRIANPNQTGNFFIGPANSPYRTANAVIP
jgi:prepilin-type processing-associated H-X9-DG protein